MAPDIYENRVEYIQSLRSWMFGENSNQGKTCEKTQQNSGDKSEKFSFAGWLSTSNAPKSLAGETACFQVNEAKSDKSKPDMKIL